MTKSYQWYYDGAAIGGATGKTYTLTSGQTDSNLIECRTQVDYGTDSVAALAEYSAGAVARTYVTSAEISPGVGTSSTFSGVSLGSSGDGDLLIGMSFFAGTPPTFTSVTAAGNTLTLVEDGSANPATFLAGGTIRTSWYRGSVSQSTGDVVFTYNASTGVPYHVISVYRLANAAATAHAIVGEEDNTTLASNLGVLADGAAFGQFLDYTTASHTFSGLTSDGHQNDGASYGCDFGSTLTASTTTLSIGATGVNYACFVGVSFGPA